MRGTGVLVGREGELARLRAALERAELGHGSVVVLAGGAGVGKTRLMRQLAEGSRALTLTGTAAQAGTPPYGPMVAALRSFLRAEPAGLDECGTLAPHLALLLPELGEPAKASDPQTIAEAVRGALARVAGERHALVVLDDLQWSDEATLELVPALAPALEDMPVLVIAAYRSEGLPREHGVRRLRSALRRGVGLEELVIGPLDRAGTAAILAQALEGTAAPSLVDAVHELTEGVPFFVEELARALVLAGALIPGPRGLELSGAQFPVPDNVRDAVLLVSSELSPGARAAAEVAAVAGDAFHLDTLADLASDAALTELVDREVLVEGPDGTARFRHALTREVLYADVPWLRRRSLHRKLAGSLEAAGAPHREVAAQWLGARDDERARAALVRAAAQAASVHAHRDAAAADRQALDRWPDGEDAAGRMAVVERYARSSQAAGELAEAARAWRELADLRRSAGEEGAAADALRSLAAVHDLRGDRESAVAARRTAADAYAEQDRPAEACVERLAIANSLRLAARYAETVELARQARAEAEASGRLDLRVRALGLEGLAAARHGDYDGGLELVRSGLALAVEHELTPLAAELYQRLSVVLYDAADYRRAEDTLATALDLCRTDGDAGTEVACVTCLAYVLRDRGEWARAAEMCRELMRTGTAVFVAEGLLGSIHAHQGKLSSARRMLTSALAASSRLDQYSMTIDSQSALARVAAAESADTEAVDRCRALLDRWRRSEDHHYAVGALRWAVGFLAPRGFSVDAHACTEALTHMASRSGHPDALAALATAIAETAMAERDHDTAAEQLSRAVEIHRTLDLPLERAEIELRAGIALAAAGEREAGIERLCDAYRAARKLGARPLAAEAAGQVAALGESVARRLGRRAAEEAGAAGLSRRELEVVRLLAAGRTNREIAQDLFLSPRTVDMHVRNILRKLDCRSRVEAAGRAAELGVLL